MDGSIIVIFYSKYSKKCTEFFNLIRDSLEFRKICVDHPDIRNTLLSEKEKYSIRTVPSVLVFFSNGVMNKYEDDKAFEWVSGVLRNMKKPSLGQTGEFSANEKTPVFFQNLPGAAAVAAEKREPPLPVEPLGPLPPPPQQPQQPQNFDQDVGDSDLGMKRRIETTPLISRSESISQEQNRMDGNRNEKKVQNKKNESIKNLAQQLQAEREKEDEVLNPNAVTKIVA
jgi:hypothetical protein